MVRQCTPTGAYSRWLQVATMLISLLLQQTVMNELDREICLQSSNSSLYVTGFSSNIGLLSNR